MLNKIIEFSVKNKLIIGLFIVGLISYGIVQVTKLPIDAVPDITNNQVQIITIAPSYGATDIERLVTFPIEQVNSNLPGLIEIRSFSRFGLSIVTIVFNDETDIYWARQQVAERLQQVKSVIPQEIGNPELGPVTTGLGEIYQYAVLAKKGYEKKYSDTELRTIQDWIIKRQLMGVKGVAEVSSFGGKLKQYEIAVDPNKLKSFNITIHDVFRALESNNQNTGGAYIEKGPTVLYIRSEGLIGSIDDINDIAIKTNQDGTPLFVKDIAKVQYGYATRYGALCYNDKGEAAGGIVMMLKGANSNDVITDVKKRIEQIKKTLPEGVVIEPFLDRTKMVNNAIGTVEKNLLEGALIVIFVLVLFLGNFRAGLLVASVIPLAMLFAVIMMNTFGVSGNLMSLGALDFGLIVDGAVIIVEAVMHQLAHSKKFATVKYLPQKQMDKEVKHSASKMMNSAVFGQVIILVVYLPIFTLQGIEGKMFKPMAQTVAFALLGAFILSLTYIPMMSSVFLSKKISHKKTFSDKLMEVLENFYEKRLSKILLHPKIVITTILTLFIFAVFTLTQLGGEFIPALEEGDFAVETRVLTGSSLNTMVENSTQAAKILKTNFQEVEKVVTKIGSGEVPTDPMPMDAADMMIILKDRKEWTNAKTFNELAEKMGTALQDVPGVSFGFQYPVQMRFNELMTGAKQDVVCKIFGEDLDTLAHYANKLGKIISSIDGAHDVYVEAVNGMPQIIIKYNRSLIAQYGLSISDVNKVVNSAFAGQSSGMVFEGEKRFDLVVRLDKPQRNDLEDVKNLLIQTPSGNQVPLNQLAKIEIKNGPNQIQREDAKRRIIVGFNVRDRDVQSIVTELQEKVEKEIKFQTGYYPTYGGSFENLNAAKQRLSVAVPVSLVLIFLLLYFAFNSIKHGLLIYSAIPLSAIGGIFALALRGMPFSISAGVGFIALFGVAVLNGIVLISEFNRLKAEGISDLKEIVLTGTKLRLRPVLMTAFVASLGFLPMALSNGAGSEVQRPLATVVIGGLLIATLLTLFVLPILYVLFESNSAKKNNTTLTSASIIVVLLTISNVSFSQEIISFESAIDSALKNNLNIRQEKLRAEYQQKLIKTSGAVPQTMINVGYGQINSSYYDNQFGISQTFNFPVVYVKQKHLLSEEWKSSILSTNLKEAEIKRNVALLYFQIQTQLLKQKLLQQNDSLYSDFLKKSELKFKTGENGLLEKTTAETQRAQITIQLQQLNTELQTLILEFQLTLNSKKTYLPDVNYKKLESGNSNSQNTSVSDHPSIKLLKQQQTISFANTKLEKTKLLPDIMFLYNNMSMKGMGADDVLYNSSSRFQSAQIGIGLPLFFGAQRAKIKSAKTHQLIQDNNLQIGLKQLELEYIKAINQHQTSKTILSYFENQGITNAQKIKQIALKQFGNGEINYLEWVLLTNQAIQLEIDYINALYQYNEAIIQLNYLSSK